MTRKLLFSLVLSAFLSFLIGCGDEDGEDGVTPPPSVSENKLNVEIFDASISSNPVVTFRLTDDRGDPIDRIAAGVRTRFIIATINNGEDQYTDYITNPADQADFEGSGANPLGTFEDMPDGVSKYTFNKALPENFDRNATHTVGIFADRVVNGLTYVSNATFDFVPSGAGVKTVRDVVSTEACNNCHDPLEAHGGFRRDVRLCVLCHSPQTIDPETGNTVDFPVLIHKIHRGAELPSVQAGTPYQIVGFQGNVFDFSTVRFPQDIRNCTKCHTGGTQSDNFKIELSRDDCGSCHDDVNFVSGENHGGGIQLDDNNCSTCHLPSTDKEFGISVEGSHTVPLKSVQVPGVNFVIVKVESMEDPGDTTVAPGEHPVVTFRITTDAGEVIPPSSLNFLRLTLAGPTTDYNIQDYNDDGTRTPGDPTSPWTPGGEAYKQENLLRPNANVEGPDADGNFTYAFTAPIPSDASTYTVGIEGYKCATVQGANQRKGGIACTPAPNSKDLNGNGIEDVGEVFNEVRDAGQNVVFDFPVTDVEAVPRRKVVDTSTKCLACHQVFSSDFSVHGNIRNNSEYCVLCHNPSYDTLSRQIPPIGEPAMTNPVNFRVMIHKIHRGEDLANKPYLLYAPPGGTFPNQFERADDFAEIRFPGDLRDCEACHLSGTHILNPGRGILGDGILLTTNREFVRGETTKTVTETFFTSPIISVCTSCHDELGVNETGDALTGENHSIANIVASENDCVECHGAGEPLGVENVHLPGLPPDRRIERPQ
ncbi:MAG: OmcA/MtrC family decaheme c-type cytochrome [Thermodesulfobacteriota bacterium]